MTRLSAGAITGLGVIGSNNNQIDAKLEELAQNYLNGTDMKCNYNNLII